jgi:sigma-B regulation protein RsbU (phosphoserine phosphatase)
LEDGCIGIGMLDNIPTVQEGHLDLTHGSAIMCYTDGLVEQENDREEEFGMERMISVMTNGEWNNLTEMIDQMIGTFEEFRGGTPYLDDTAIFSLRVL